MYVYFVFSFSSKHTEETLVHIHYTCDHCNNQSLVKTCNGCMWKNKSVQIEIKSMGRVTDGAVALNSTKIQKNSP